MLRETKTGHYDGDLCCGNCGRRGPWQPQDKDPCTDDWWCRTCGQWGQPYDCGRYPLQRVVMRNGRTELRPVCAVT